MTLNKRENLKLKKEILTDLELLTRPSKMVYDDLNHLNVRDPYSPQE